MRHKHADIIHAWAEGNQIQVRDLPNKPWIDLVLELRWNANYYRVKPKTIKFKSYLWKHKTGAIGIYAAQSTDTNKLARLPQSEHFVKWVGDWQEVEID